MSLTPFLKDNADVRERFQQEFTKPQFLFKKHLVCPPLTKHSGQVGTAFDYLLRFVVQRANAQAICKGCWVAETAVELLVDDDTLYSKGEEIVSRARRDLANYLKTGQMCDALVESALLLATLDPIYRAGVEHDVIGRVEGDDIQDLKNLIAAVDQKLFTAGRLCLLNPTFGRASTLVGGADADLVIDDTIIDVKSTKKLSLERAALDQLLGYYVLHQIGGVGELDPKPTITKLAIYFARYGYLYIMQLSELCKERTFPEFVRWFERRAAEAFSSR